MTCGRGRGDLWVGQGDLWVGQGQGWFVGGAGVTCAHVCIYGM